MNIKILILLLLTACSAHAEISQQEIEADCHKIKKLSVSGNKYYKLQQYAKARQEYEQQAAWAESCGLDDAKVASAYNNVALTYIHQGEYLKARAWLNLAPKNKKSIFNLNKIKNDTQKSVVKLSSIPEGEYWQYVGKSIWNVITIKKEKQKYRFDFSGFYAGLMTMYYGPNIGEFSTVLDIKNRRASYAMVKDDAYLDCVYDFIIKEDTLTVKRISGNSCGFGHNVTADGIYLKVGL
jgi:tetratricopeptide (TPR) repeat protein